MALIRLAWPPFNGGQALRCSGMARRISPPVGLGTHIYRLQSLPRAASSVQEP